MQPSTARPQLLMEPAGRWTDLQNGIRLGQAFAFFVPELAQSAGWLANLMGGSTSIFACS